MSGAIQEQVPHFHKMNPTIEVVVIVRKIVAADYNDAISKAWDVVWPAMQTTLLQLGFDTREGFIAAARAAKEASGMFTVTLP